MYIHMCLCFFSDDSQLLQLIQLSYSSDFFIKKKQLTHSMMPKFSLKALLKNEKNSSGFII